MGLETVSRVGDRVGGDCVFRWTPWIGHAAGQRTRTDDGPGSGDGDDGNHVVGMGAEGRPNLRGG